MPTKLPPKRKKVKVAATQWTPGEGQERPQSKSEYGDFEFHADDQNMDSDNKHGSGDLREESTDKKPKQKKDIKQAFKNIKSKFSRKRNKNGVKEISIKPEAEVTNECWASETVSYNKRGRGGSSIASSSRASSANSSKNSNKLEDLEDDGIEVIYDAAIQGGQDL